MVSTADMPVLTLMTACLLLTPIGATGNNRDFLRGTNAGWETGRRASESKEEESGHQRKNAGYEGGKLTGVFALHKQYNLGADPLNEWDVANYSDEHLTRSCSNYINDGSTVFTKDGNLVLRVNSACEGIDCLNSGRVMSKQGFKYGLFSFTARVPKCNDIWPAIWLLPGDVHGHGPYGTWPCSGEIDILETVGDHNFGTFNLVSGRGDKNGKIVCNKCRPPGYMVSSTLKNGSAGAYFIEDVDCSAERSDHVAWREHTWVFHWEPGKLTTWIDPIIEKDAYERVISVMPQQKENYGSSVQATHIEPSLQSTEPAPAAHTQNTATAPSIPSSAAPGDHCSYPTWKTYDKNTTEPWKEVDEYMETCFSPDVATANAPFDIPFKIVFNIAVGGWGGARCAWTNNCSSACGGAIGSELVISDISVWQSI